MLRPNIARLLRRIMPTGPLDTSLLRATVGRAAAAGVGDGGGRAVTVNVRINGTDLTAAQLEATVRSAMLKVFRGAA